MLWFKQNFLTFLYKPHKAVSFFIIRKTRIKIRSFRSCECICYGERHEENLKEVCLRKTEKKMELKFWEPIECDRILRSIIDVIDNDITAINNIYYLEQKQPRKYKFS